MYFPGTLPVDTVIAPEEEEETTMTNATLTAGRQAVPWRPVPVHERDGRFVDLAARVGVVAGASAASHDAANTFVDDGYDVMRETGYLTLAVPEEFGGLGASLRQACFAQHELARHCGATALASAMHHYNCYVQVYRHRKGAGDAAGILRRVAGEGLIITTSGGSDWLWPTTVAQRHDGGFLVSGRKRFCSQAPAGKVMTTSAVIGEPGEGAEVIMFSVPMNAPGFTIDPTWDTLGMRGTASHDAVLSDVFVPEERVVARRPWGKFNPALLAAAVHFAPLVGSVYHGIAAAARDEAVRVASQRTRGDRLLKDTPAIQRQVGLMDAMLRTSWWSLMGALEELGEDYVADASSCVTVMTAKREAVLAARSVVDLAMDACGGSSFFRSSPLERAYRDVRAGAFHPLTPEATLYYTGRLALGGDVDTE
jgi:acyl-CoA dehydrogenase